MSDHLPGTQVNHFPLARCPLVDLDRAASSQHTRIKKLSREQASLQGYVQVLMERQISAPDILLQIAPNYFESDWTGPTARLPARLRGPSVLAPPEIHSVSLQILPSNINHLHGSSLPENKTASSYVRSTRMERRRSVASMSAPDTAAPTLTEAAWARRPRRNSAPDSPADLFLLGHDQAATSPETPLTRRAARESPRAVPWIGDLVCGASSGRAPDVFVPPGLASVADLLLRLPAADQCAPSPRALASTLNSKPWTMNPEPHTLHTTPYTLHSTPYTLNPTPFSLNPEPSTLNPNI